MPYIRLKTASNRSVFTPIPINKYSHILPDIALWLFPAYIHDTSMCEELFAFFHTVLDVLKSQMGAESIEATIGILTYINYRNISFKYI